MHKHRKISHDNLPKGFAYLSDIDPTILQYVMYATKDNFMGRKVIGYTRAVIICTTVAGYALKAAQATLKSLNSNFSLKVYDFYRPLRSSLDFYQWSENLQDQVMKYKYYPTLNKEELFNGYIAKYSSHNRGSTVDLTIYNKKTQQELDMGTIIDYLGPLANTENPNISEEAKKNRKLLKNLMSIHGFENYRLEWWHYSLQNEPFIRNPEDHFDFLVK